jgi:uncharacterized protein
MRAAKKRTPLLIKIFMVLVVFLFFILSFFFNRKQLKTSNVEKKLNPVVYFEIPVSDMERAITFYTAVFNFDFEKTMIDGNEMAYFPFFENADGITGALAKGASYKPTKNGTLVYFRTENIAETLKLVLQNGGKILFPETSNGDLGSVAEFEDCEGNRIALHMKN